MLIAEPRNAHRLRRHSGARDGRHRTAVHGTPRRLPGVYPGKAYRCRYPICEERAGGRNPPFPVLLRGGEAFPAESPHAQAMTYGDRIQAYCTAEYLYNIIM